MNISGVASFGTATSSPTGRDLDHRPRSIDTRRRCARPRTSSRPAPTCSSTGSASTFPGAHPGQLHVRLAGQLRAGRYSTSSRRSAMPRSRSRTRTSASTCRTSGGCGRRSTVDGRPALRPAVARRSRSQTRRRQRCRRALGVAWSPGDRRTVVRASAGRYLDRMPLRALSNALQRDGSKYRTAVLSFGQAGAPRFPDGADRPTRPACCRA